MTKIKIIAILAFFILGLNQSYSQTYKFKTSGLSVMQKDQKGNWGKWSNLNLVNILVKLDTDKNRIIVYSEVIQLFQIIDYIPLGFSLNSTTRPDGSIFIKPNSEAFFSLIGTTDRVISAFVSR